MSNVEEVSNEASPAPIGSKMEVPIVKGKANIEIDTSLIPDDVFQEIVLQGLKVILNRGMSKITTTGLSGKALEDAQVAAMAKAAENVEAVKTGKIKFTGKAKAKKASGAVNTEAMRIARNLVKDAMKANGIKISHVKASEITSAAKQLIEADPSIVAQAEEELAKRQAKPIAINIAGLVHTDPELVAKAEAKAAADKAKRPLSAKQAGKVKTRSKNAGANASA
ncbi:MAG: hypothetical protein E6Q97_34840 [Desulfurellales bacterium]|nr:MAG: hypothetical protein E6Q97_34840 [Desulfurellales bacterium]